MIFDEPIAMKIFIGKFLKILNIKVMKLSENDNPNTRFE